MCRILIALWITALASLAQSPVGTYLGEMNLMTTKLRLGLEVKPAGEGKFTSEMTSLDQGYAKLPATATEWDGKVLKVIVGTANVSFEGTLSEDGQSLVGKFTQGVSFDLLLKRVAELPKPARPQEPKGPPVYTVEDVGLPGGAEGVTLAGTLTLPKSAVKVPAVVLVSGSGPQNRDEEVLAHKPFLIWADSLTKAGIIVLRYDDRGVAKSTGTFRGSTTADFALDTAAAVSYLRTRKEVDPSRIVVMGHSEGGIIAPMVAANDERLAAIVLMAAPTVTGEAILRKQIPDLIKLAGGTEQQAKAQLDAIQKQADTEPWMKYFWNHDPGPVLKKVKCPVLAINGELDIQVNADINLGAIEAALKESGNKNFSIKKLPRLNHMLQSAQTGGGQEYAKIEETVSPLAISTVTEWLKQTLAMK